MAKYQDITYSSAATDLRAPQIPGRLSHVFKTDVASISFLTAEATDDVTMVSVMYALSKELDDAWSQVDTMAIAPEKLAQITKGEG